MKESARYTVLCLHGFTGAGESWQEVRKEAPSNWNLLTPELLGHGPTPDLSADTFAEEVERLWTLTLEAAQEPKETDERGGDEPQLVLVGYSLGARVALQMLRARPHRVAGALLIGVHPGLRSEAEREARREADRRWIQLLEEDGLHTFLAAWEQIPLFASQSAVVETQRHRQRAVRQAHCAKGLAASLRILGLAEMPDCWEFLVEPRSDPMSDPAHASYSDRRTPVVLLVGSQDQKFLALARAMQQHCAPSSAIDLQLRIAEGCGHNVLLERPEEVLIQLRELIEQLSTSRIPSVGNAR